MKNIFRTTVAIAAIANALLVGAVLSASSANAFPVAVAHPVVVPHVTVTPHVAAAPHVTPAAHVAVTPHVAPVVEAAHVAPSAAKAASAIKPVRAAPAPVVMNPTIGFGAHNKCADQNKAGCKQ